jgi:hypothetical protein
MGSRVQAVAAGASSRQQRDAAGVTREREGSATGGSIGAACSLRLMVDPAARGDHRGMSLTAYAPSPPSLAARRDGTTNADGQRAGPSGQCLFDAAADLLAAACALAANAGVPTSSTALGPSLACMEASLEALAETAQRIGEDASAEADAERISRPIAAGSFDHLAATLRSATSACNDARRAAAASL